MMKKTIKYVSIKLVGVLVLFFASVSLHASEKRDLLMQSASQSDMEKYLIPDQQWVKFPTYADRSFWNNQPASVREAFIKRGESRLAFNWDNVRATDYLALGRTGNRVQMQNPDNQRKAALKELMMAELFEGKGRFIDQIIDGVWAMCEQSSWVLSAHLYLQKHNPELPDVQTPVVDLGAGEMGAWLAWAHYLFKAQFDKESPLIAQRIELEIKKRILEPYYAHNDFWWMGLTGDSTPSRVNNWNPWINFNVLTCILLIENDPAKRAQYVHKTMRSVDQFINYYHDDGACEEGPSYWSHAGGKFFEYLELLNMATGGKVSIFQHPLVKNIGSYIYKVYISDPYFVNFADASAKGTVNAGLLYRYGAAVGDETMKNFGSFYVQKRGLDKGMVNGSIYAMLNDLQWMPKMVADKAAEPLIGEYWFPETEIAGGREHPGSKQGFYFAAKGGYNDEFHNHNDVGSFVLYYNGLPCLVDAGVGTYTKQTFSKDRYKIWTMQSGFHNLPVANGYEQPFGPTYRATQVDFKGGKQLQFSADLTRTYPKEADVLSWVRRYTLDRKQGKFVVDDQFRLGSFKKANELHFLTPCKPKVIKPGVCRLSVGNEWVEIHYDVDHFGDPKVVDISIDDSRLLGSWPTGILYQLVFSAKQEKTIGNYIFEIVKSK